MTTKHLLESADLLAPADNGDGTWKVRLISEGVGSSGIYSRELIESFHSAFDNSLSFENHPATGPESRNFTQIVGRVVGETWTEEDEDGLLGAYANYKPDADYKNKLTEYKDQLGLSIFIEGSGSEDANGNFLVESFNGDDPYKSVDVVIAAGRGGRFEESLKKIYSPRIRAAESEKPGAASAQEPNTKEQHMTPEQLTELKEFIAAAVAESVKSIAEAKVEKDEEKLSLAEALAAYAETVKLIDAAELLPSQTENLKARAAKGEDITAALEEAKTLKAEALASVQVENQSTSSSGRTLGEGASYKGATAWGGR